MHYLCSVAQLCLALCNSMDCSRLDFQTLSMGFSGQEYWSGLPPPNPGDLPDPGIEPVSLSSPALAGRFFATVPPGNPMDGQRSLVGYSPWGQLID